MQSINYLNNEYQPSKIICVGRNYAEHIKELNNQNPEELVLFLKPNSSVSREVKLPEGRCRYEGEISFLMKNGKISGVGFGIDLTLVDVQNRLKEKGLPWEKAKAFNGSAVFSDFVEVEEVNNLSLKLYLNDKLCQDGGIELMIYKPADIIDEVKKHFSIEDYDIIMSGTPSGVGFLENRDIIRGEIFAGKDLLIAEKWQIK
ncbi:MULTISPECIES: fumarylacetoacetate hydrolase family protein [unclassified Halanaerobium]|uniref:fumarylacetoacetate hydrolase family protein n=1 Tax=unclassified Halanaerobium TaxID=2641197 RepID=UPI000DF3AC7C|nr:MULTISPECIES: fumarylacetoacetate hydrolase family protein [unclassified Halanaerobium]RCW50545.1 2-keto-4-pentenoate hydratase/2-oxohepta-3-ene-1,7-dioic acid hydratase in catechol pathway [Halanaerobium sp. MA284_MarDTE_T2]RCW77965.1 2-keto-4-pentenoate hydratase/2-oxohepta-3-ene-1,7-dioic acid hydratase in catechol pathway [Halanaerobium sp. DL-01]